MPRKFQHARTGGASAICAGRPSTPCQHRHARHTDHGIAGIGPAKSRSIYEFCGDGWINPSALLASDLAKDLRNFLNKKPFMVPVYGQVAQSFARTSHVDFETRYNRTRVMTSRANGGAVALRQKK